MSFNDMTNEQVVARYGGTTWERIQDRYLVAASSSSHIVGSTGGSSTVTLTTDNLPSHSHNYYRSNTSTGSTTLTTNQIPSHDHGFNGGFTFTWGVGGLSGQVSIPSAEAMAGPPTSNNLTTSQNDWSKTALTGGGGSHSHSITRTSVASDSTGSGTAFSIEPPYIAIYMWRRTA